MLIKLITLLARLAMNRTTPIVTAVVTAEAVVAVVVVGTAVAVGTGAGKVNLAKNKSWKRSHHSNNQRSNSNQSAQPSATGPARGQRALLIRLQQDDGRYDHIQCHNCRNYGHKAANCPHQRSVRYTHATQAPPQSIPVGPSQPILTIDNLPHVNYQLTQSTGQPLVQPQQSFAPAQQTLQFSPATTIEPGFNPRQAFVTVKQKKSLLCP